MPIPSWVSIGTTTTVMLGLAGLLVWYLVSCSAHPHTKQTSSTPTDQKQLSTGINPRAPHKTIPPTHSTTHQNPLSNPETLSTHEAVQAWHAFVPETSNVSAEAHHHTSASTSIHTSTLTHTSRQQKRVMRRLMCKAFQHLPIALMIPAQSEEEAFYAQIVPQRSTTTARATNYPIYRYTPSFHYAQASHHATGSDTTKRIRTRHITDVPLPSRLRLTAAAQLHTLHYIWEHGNHTFVIVSPNNSLRIQPEAQDQLAEVLEREYRIHRTRTLTPFTSEYIMQECIAALKLSTPDRERLWQQTRGGLESLFDLPLDILQVYRLEDIPLFQEQVDTTKLSELTPLHTLYQVWLIHQGHHTTPIRNARPEQVRIGRTPNDNPILTMPVWTQPAELFEQVPYISEHTHFMYPHLRPLLTHKERAYLHIPLQGGMGNQLFQLAALDHLCRLTGRDPVLSVDHHHASPYWDSFWSTWRCFLLPTKKKGVDFPTIQPLQEKEFSEQALTYQAWKPQLDTHRRYDAIITRSYFQDYRYIDADFLTRVQWPAVELTEAETSKVFIHIRGGDYVNHPLHGINLEHYYVRAIQQFPAETEFIIFTNDYPYAQRQPWIQNLARVSYADNTRSDIVELTHMSMCRGGICANSSFSFWAAFRLKALAQSSPIPYEPLLTMPNQWYHHTSPLNRCTAGYYFPGITMVPCDPEPSDADTLP